MKAEEILTPSAELGRLGAEDAGAPSTWLGPLEIRVSSEDPRLSLDRVREVMRVVLENLPSAPSYETWATLLPRWFVSQHVEDVLPDDDRWSLPGWIDWFVDEERSWVWWDSRVVSPDAFVVRILSNGLPFAWGALEWLLHCAGGVALETDF